MTWPSRVHRLDRAATAALQLAHELPHGTDAALQLLQLRHATLDQDVLLLQIGLLVTLGLDELDQPRVAGPQLLHHLRAIAVALLDAPAFTYIKTLKYPLQESQTRHAVDTSFPVWC